MILSMEILGLPHCPRNRSHRITTIGKFAKEVKTEAANEYEKAITIKLAKYNKEAEEFRSKFNPAKNYLTAIWELTSPNIFTKSGAISRNSTDLDAHKVLQDTVMRFVGIDDAYITTDRRSKLQGEFCVKVILEIKELDGGHLL